MAADGAGAAAWADPTGLRGRFGTAVAAAGADLPPAGATVVLAVSGGADSCALWDLCAGLGRWRLVVWHLDHGLRPDAAADADLVAARARHYAALGVATDLRLARRAVAAAARRARQGVEAAGRALRLRLLRDTVAATGAAGAMTAHHAGDQVETVLMQCLRGAGPRGAPGLRARRRLDGLTLWRPLLAFTRDELRAHLAALGLDWREDPTNRDASFRRNLLRLRVIPACEAAAPGFCAALARRAAAAPATDDPGPAITAALPAATLALDPAWMADPAARRRRWAALLTALKAGTGRSRVRLLDTLIVPIAPLTLAPSPPAEGPALQAPPIRPGPAGHGLRLGRWEFLFDARAQQVRWRPWRRTRLTVPAVAMPRPGRYRRGGRELDLEPAPVPTDAHAGPGACWLDADALRWPLSWRAAHPGERWRPLGCAGHQAIAKYLAGRGIPADDRRGVAVVADADGVVWIPGFGIAERVRISARTRAALAGRETGLQTPAP